MSNKPPIALEQWVSLVLALASHRSQNEGHREFGSRLTQFVFEELPSRHKDNETARAYFDHVLAEVAWAVRGFSNVRDHFARQVDSEAKVAEEQQEKAKKHLDHSPFQADSILSKTLSVGVGAGGSAILPALFPKVATPWLVIIGVGLAFLVHFVLEWLTSKRVERIVGALPAKTYGKWTDDSQPKYERIIEAFCAKVQDIERTFYPDELARDVEPIIQRAFAFGVRTSEQSFPRTGVDCARESQGNGQG